MATSSPIAKAYETAEQAYIIRNPASESIYKSATDCLPGGNTRTVLYYAPFPLSINYAHGALLHDADGHSYIDLLGEYTAGLYGHSDPWITEAIKNAVDRGLSFGSQHEDEVRLAEAVKARFPAIDLLRFTNSGTEATLMALSAAKVFTGRKKILVFNGGYHGGAFSFKGGESSPVNAPHEYLIAKYNSLESVRDLVEHAENRDDLAAIIVEPMIGSGGAIPGDHAFLEGLRDVANDRGAVLIYDEVMTSRLYSGSGVQSQLAEKYRPDLTTLGKWIGGGMSFGAFGGKKEIMALFDPRTHGFLAHAGTFNNNVLTMAAGRVGMEKVFTPQRAQELHDRGEKLRSQLQEVSEGSLMTWTGLGSIMNVTFTTTPAAEIKCPDDFGKPLTELGDLLHVYLLERGFYIARRGFIALSLALSDGDLANFVDVVREFLKQYQHLTTCVS
jgi:glutamate-1-semialdehyde 2,1-aminomutase